jgi:hypothetical protein
MTLQQNPQHYVYLGPWLEWLRRNWFATLAIGLALIVVVMMAIAPPKRGAPPSAPAPSKQESLPIPLPEPTEPHVIPPGWRRERDRDLPPLPTTPYTSRLEGMTSEERTEYLRERSPRYFTIKGEPGRNITRIIFDKPIAMYPNGCASTITALFGSPYVVLKVGTTIEPIPGAPATIPDAELRVHPNTVMAEMVWETCDKSKPSSTRTCRDPAMTFDPEIGMCSSRRSQPLTAAEEQQLQELSRRRDGRRNSYNPCPRGYRYISAELGCWKVP